MKTILALVAALPFAFAHGAGNDDLWEVTSKMDVPGMPAGMGAQKNQVCAEKGDPKKAMQSKGSEKCKMVDFKQSGNKYTMTMQCPDGTATIENTFNAAHTEYNGTVKMTSKRGDMTIAMAGRKVGTCDAQQAKAKQQETAAMYQREGAKAKGDIAAMWEQKVQECKRAPDTMKAGDLGMCAGGPDAVMCKRGNDEQFNHVVDTCTASRTEFCKRYPTMDGFLKAKADEMGAKTCNVSREQLVKTHCSAAAQAENLSYLSSPFCSAQARPLAQKHCVGRSFTSKKDKYTEFCRTFLAKNSLEEEGEDSQPAAATPHKVDPKQAVQQGVTQGINKLKGLFGK